MRPVLAQSLLNGLHIYIVTRYKLKPHPSGDPAKAILVAERKHDVTHLFEMVRGRVTLREGTTLTDQLKGPAR